MGVAIMLTSVMCEALRLVLMQRLMAGRSLHPVEGLMYLGPACSGWLLLTHLLFESRRLLSSRGLGILAAHPLSFAVAMVIGFGGAGCVLGGGAQGVLRSSSGLRALAAHPPSFAMAPAMVVDGSVECARGGFGRKGVQQHTMQRGTASWVLVPTYRQHVQPAMHYP